MSPVSEEDRHAAQERLEELLMEGLNSGPSIEMTEEYWAQKEAELLKRIEKQPV